MVLLSRNRRVIRTTILLVVVIYGLLGLVLWTSMPFNCTREECGKFSFEELNNRRLEFLLSYATGSAVIIIPSILIVIHNAYNARNYLSTPGVVALAWPAIAYPFLATLEFVGWFVAFIGIFLSITAIGIDWTKSSKVKAKVPKGDYVSLLVNLCWFVFSYFFLMGFWSIFGD